MFTCMLSNFPEEVIVTVSPACPEEDNCVAILLLVPEFTLVSGSITKGDIGDNLTSHSLVRIFQSTLNIQKIIILWLCLLQNTKDFVYVLLRNLVVLYIVAVEQI